MSHLWVEIEALVLDGVPLNAADGRRMAQLTEVALTRLLEQRGTSTRVANDAPDKPDKKDARQSVPATMRVRAGANEGRWAEELASVLYRAMDRTF